jgi:hypothetical protein
LDNNSYRDIITKNYKQVLINTSELTKEKVLSDCYTNTLSTRPGKHNALDIMYSKDNNKENSSYGISVNTSVSDDKKIHAVLYYDINYLDKTDKASDYELKDIRINYYFKYISPLLPHKITDKLKDGLVGSSPRYDTEYQTNYKLYETNIHSLQNDDSQSDTIITNYKDNDVASYDAYYLIDNLRIGLFNKNEEDYKFFYCGKGLASDFEMRNGKKVKAVVGYSHFLDVPEDKRWAFKMSDPGSELGIDDDDECFDADESVIGYIYLKSDKDIETEYDKDELEELFYDALGITDDDY